MIRKGVNNMAKRISISELCADWGVADIHELLKDSELNGLDGTAPALCEESCMVEPDGRCPHGHPSVLLALGFI